MASGTITKLMIGAWDLCIDVYSIRGELLYQGKTSILVEENKKSTASVTLATAPGELTVQLDLVDFTGPQAIKGKVILNTGAGEEIIKEFSPGQDKRAEVIFKELAPRSYDLKVDIYSGTYHAYNRIYQGPWQVVAITSGGKLNLAWGPALGLVEIVGKVDLPPPPPTDVTAVLQGANVLISWAAVTPIEDDLLGYRVYAQNDIFQGFELVAEIPAPLTSHYYRLPGEPPQDIQGLAFAVSSIDKQGHESIRSSPIYME